MNTMTHKDTHPQIMSAEVPCPNKRPGGELWKNVDHFSKLYVKERCERNTSINNYQKIIPGENMSSSAAFFWDTLFAIMIVVAIFGNTAVLWIVMRK